MIRAYLAGPDVFLPDAAAHVAVAAFVTPADGRDRAFDSLEIFEACVTRAAAARRN